MERLANHARHWFGLLAAILVMSSGSIWGASWREINTGLSSTRCSCRRTACVSDSTGGIGLRMPLVFSSVQRCARPCRTPRFLSLRPAEPHSTSESCAGEYGACSNPAAALGVDREVSTSNGGLER
jgi:hypothetical protein